LEDENIDQLLADIEKPEGERSMTGAEPAPSPEEAAAPAPEAAPQWNANEWEFDWNGKKVAPNSREKLMTWASQGHNYSQRMAEVNRLQKEAQAVQERFKGYDRYTPVDKYAKENPAWWDHVEKSYADRETPQQGQDDPSLQAIINPLKEQIQTLNQWREAAEQERTQQELKRADDALQTDIDSIRETHPTIDFDAADQSGRTLEKRIIDHANEIGTASFRAAFRDYLHDQILESAKAQSLTAQVKAKTVPGKPGITVSPTPRRDEGPVAAKGRSYDAITKSVLKEYGIN